MSSDPDSATSSALIPEAQPDRERRNPLYRWVMHLGLPAMVSIVLHITLFLVMGFKTWEVLTQPGIDVGEYEAGITEDLSDQLASAFKWPEEQELETEEMNLDDSLESLTDLRDLSELSATDFEASDELDTGGGFGLGEGERGGILGLGGGAGEAGSGGFGTGFGGRRRIGQAGVWNLRVEANKIAYVVDFSGSIIVAVDDLKRELKRSVGRLKPSQSFDVTIFYSSGTGDRERFKTESFGGKLQPAQPDVKREFFTWIERKPPQGHTDPLPAMKRALKLDPDVVFFFSDGLFDEDYVEKISQANRAARARIYCLVFDDILLQDTSGLVRWTDGAKRLKRISEQSKGETKVVTGLDLTGR